MSWIKKQLTSTVIFFALLVIGGVVAYFGRQLVVGASCSPSATANAGMLMIFGGSALAGIAALIIIIQIWSLSRMVKSPDVDIQAVFDRVTASHPSGYMTANELQFAVQQAAEELAKSEK